MALGTNGLKSRLCLQDWLQNSQVFVAKDPLIEIVVLAYCKLQENSFDKEIIFNLSFANSQNSIQIRFEQKLQINEADFNVTIEALHDIL